MRMISYKQHAELLKKLSKQISYLQYFLPWRMGMPVLANPGGKAGIYQTYRLITEKYADIRQRMAEKVEVVPELAESQPEVIGGHYDVPIFALYRKERKGRWQY